MNMFLQFEDGCKARNQRSGATIANPIFLSALVANTQRRAAFVGAAAETWPANRARSKILPAKSMVASVLIGKAGNMPVEPMVKRRERVGKITGALRKTYPEARIALNFHNPLELLVATILSAQCTDKRVNMVTEHLFKKYRSAADYAAADPQVFEEEIHSTGFFRNKARSILGAAARIIAEFGGKVPDNMADLLALPGVARKTANVVLSGAFGKNEGIVVDTHVIRLSQRLKLSRHQDNTGDKIENDLVELVPRKDWADFGNMLIWHGRLICEARRPKCAECPINHLCPSRLPR